MSTIPNYMPVLSRGAHSGPSEGACIMEYASFLAGEEWSDTPSCTHTVLALVAQRINDDLSDADRHMLFPLLARLMGTSTGKNDPALSVRLAVWAARQVAHLNPDPRVMAAIKAAEAWALNPASDATPAATAAIEATHSAVNTDTVAALSAAAAASAAAHASHADFYAAHAAEYASRSTGRTAADQVEFLTNLITEYDRLTGRTEHPTVTEADLRRCAELTA